MQKNKKNHEGPDASSSFYDDLGTRIMRGTMLLRRYLHSNINMTKLHDVCGRNSWILYFINEQTRAGRMVCQKDIEKNFSITRSSVSKILRRLEDRQIIIRSSVEGDARLKSIVLTEEGTRLCENAVAEKNALEEAMVKGLTPEEVKKFRYYLDVLADNLEHSTAQRPGFMKKKEAAGDEDA